MYRIHLTEAVEVVDKNSSTCGTTLGPGDYNVIEIENPYNVPGRPLGKRWLALLHRPHIGQCRDAWEEKPGVRIIKVESSVEHSIAA